MLRIFVLAVVAFAVVAPSAARDLVVDNRRGSDSHNDRGLLPGAVTFGPYRTINRALLAAQPGDRIVLTNTGRPYRESVTLEGLRHSGTEFAPFEIVGNGAVLDGSVAVGADDWEPFSEGLLRLRWHRPGYGLLFGPEGPLPHADPLDLASLEPGSWTRRTGEIFYRPPVPERPEAAPEAVTHRQVGLTIYNIRHVVIRDLTVRGYWLDGINVHGQAGGVQLEDVTCVANGRSGVSVGGACRAALARITCRDNGRAQLRTEGACRVELLDARLQGTESAPAIVREGGRIIRIQPQ